MFHPVIFIIRINGTHLFQNFLDINKVEIEDLHSIRNLETKMKNMISGQVFLDLVYFEDPRVLSLVSRVLYGHQN